MPEGQPAHEIPHGQSTKWDNRGEAEMSKPWITTKRDRLSQKYRLLHLKLKAEVEADRNQEPGTFVWWVMNGS